MNLWLDDMRTPPATGVWHWVKDYDEAIKALSTFQYEWVAFDHDLSLEHYANLEGTDFKEKTGYDVALWMAEHNIWPSKGCSVHSFNPEGAKRICGVVNRYGPFDKPCIHTPASGMGKA